MFISGSFHTKSKEMMLAVNKGAIKNDVHKQFLHQKFKGVHWKRDDDYTVYLFKYYLYYLYTVHLYTKESKIKYFDLITRYYKSLHYDIYDYYIDN